MALTSKAGRFDISISNQHRHGVETPGSKPGIGNAPGPADEEGPEPPRQTEAAMSACPENHILSLEGVWNFRKRGSASRPTAKLPSTIDSQAGSRPLKPLKLLAAAPSDNFSTIVGGLVDAQAAMSGLWSLNKGRERSWLSPAPNATAR